MTLKSVFGRIHCTADINTLAVFRIQQTGVVNPAVFDQIIAAVVNDVDGFVPDVKHLAVGNDAVFRLCQKDALAGRADFQVADYPVRTGNIQRTLRRKRLRTDHCRMLRIFTAQNDRLFFGPVSLCGKRSPAAALRFIDALAQYDLIAR